MSEEQLSCSLLEDRPAVLSGSDSDIESYRCQSRYGSPATRHNLQLPTSLVEWPHARVLETPPVRRCYSPPVASIRRSPREAITLGIESVGRPDEDCSNSEEQNLDCPPLDLSVDAVSDISRAVTSCADEPTAANDRPPYPTAYIDLSNRQSITIVAFRSHTSATCDVPQVVSIYGGAICIRLLFLPLLCLCSYY